MSGEENAFRQKVLAGTATHGDYRRELARRIRSKRAVCVANDPQRGYRRGANECRKTGRYARQFGIGRAPKASTQPVEADE